MATQADPTRLSGLSSSEAAERLRRFGFNELPRPDRRNFGRIFFDAVREPMFALLLGGALLYILLGEAVDAIVLSAFAVISVSISIVQESRSERVLDALRNLASPRARVVRDGCDVRIPGREVVPDDIVLIAEGDRIPADAIVLVGHDLLVDESLLTGESLPVRKVAGERDAPWHAPGGENLPFVFAGTLVTQGSGVAAVTAIAAGTEMGKIGQALVAISLAPPRLQTQLRWLVRDFAIAGVAVAAAVVLLFGFFRGAWLKAALAGIAIGMSVLPEEFPLIISVFMAMGAWRISRARVLTRRAAAIETLGSATVLCTDKTGTLTENRMSVEVIVEGRNIWRRGGAEHLSGPFSAVLATALKASARRPTDPMDRALNDAGRPLVPPQDGETLVRAYALRPDLFATTNIWADKSGGLTACAKGAPEAIAELCSLSPTQREEILRRVDGLAGEGIRVLAVAEAVTGPHVLSDTPRGLPFVFRGLVGFADPIRANVRAAMGDCVTAGVRVIMITGDYPATAQAIARQAGIDATHVLTGDELERLSDGALAERMRATTVCARIRPTQKLRIVEALKKDGEIAAMTGDGVNDAPAMKAADIAIAMGGRGTDVAREAASLVLLDDDFSSIVAAIRLGRRIYDNLRKAIVYTMAVHVPIAGLAILPLAMGLPLILAPVHIAFLEMIIDPACSIVFESEPEEDDIMRRPPRDTTVPVLPRRLAIWAIAQGLAAFLVVSVALFAGWRIGMPEADLRAFVFTVLVLMNVGLILVNRSFASSMRSIIRSNRTFWLLLAGVAALLAIAIYWPPAEALFHFGVLHWDDLLSSVALGVPTILILQWIKRTALRPVL
jgi:Ca2+-transporting ATPase